MTTISKPCRTIRRQRNAAANALERAAKALEASWRTLTREEAAAIVRAMIREKERISAWVGEEDHTRQLRDFDNVWPAPEGVQSDDL